MTDIKDFDLDVRNVLGAVLAEAERMYIAHEEQEVPTQRDEEVERTLMRGRVLLSLLPPE